MAERRMFSKTIIDSDAFLEMPVSARLLYYDLSMRADDEGFVNSPKKIMRMVGASEDDLRILSVRKFIIPFESGVVVIKHWKIHNYIQKDRFKETNYKEERATLSLDENNAYTQCIHSVSILDTQDRLEIGKDSIGKSSIGKDSVDKVNKNTPFVPPTVEMVSEYCEDNGYGIDAEEFVDFYTSKGWMVGKNKMKDWKASVRTWERQRKKKSGNDDGYEGWLKA